MEWELVKKKVAELKEWKKNPRALTEKGIKDLTESIRKFGIAEPIVINTDGAICGGHGRKKVLELENIKEVDCYQPLKKLLPKQFEELNIRLNKNIAGEFDFDILANEFEIDDLINWGFEADGLELLDTKLDSPNFEDKVFTTTFKVYVQTDEAEKYEKELIKLQDKFPTMVIQKQ